ncbi:CarboxypepD_reg-like domain-containing protein [Formosa sp. Hel1_31_208]|uniref:carboxypeptidase-like regulatory domain-containing protein n=1 Tax=Formosa sp. Hel1_31_208 TaxID=1798225 RepID=UPI000879694B|nr:carboxypeptidase-like regulatory domain-containing protein [Formosa sp. Hel1_31_208]SDR69362.1 CarboxypepD_reg-like domain-containing protein [Formosa sp. Hel1_31_208]
MKHSIVVFISFLFSAYSFSQSIKGIVLDVKTNLPIETVAVYFDNTTIGTTTNEKGEFEIDKREGVNSPLIISFLGYEKVFLTNYNSKTFYKVLLVPTTSQLDEVVITSYDGMSKALKLKYFKEQFLGQSENGASCTILNEDDLILRFNKSTKQLVASSTKPISIKNENLQYQIQFEIKDFVIDFRYVNIKKEIYRIESVIYTGTTFFKDLLKNKETSHVQRDSTYKGSVLHFMRALSNSRLEDEGYQVFTNGFKVDASKYISVRALEDTVKFAVKLRLPLSVVYNRDYQSGLRKSIKHSSGDKDKQTQKSYYNTIITIDQYGNYSPIGAFYFVGYMSNLRIGDMLPLDFAIDI